MKYRRLGQTGLRVSVVGIGTWQLSGEWGRRYTQQEVDSLLGRAQALGVNLVDTAECYGDHLAEALIGAAIHPHRDQWVVATKFGHRFHPEAMGQDRWSPERVRSDHWTPREVVAQLEGSLRALGTDRVDIYQFHSGPDEVFDQDELWEALNQQVAKGKVRHLGISLGSNTNVHQARRATQVGASVGPGRLQPPRQGPGAGRIPGLPGPGPGGYCPGAAGQRLPRRQVPAWHPDHRQRRLALRARSGGGPAEACAGGGDRSYRGARGVAMAPWALAWCLQHPAVACVVAGCKSVEHVESNARAADLDLVREDHPQATALR